MNDDQLFRVQLVMDAIEKELLRAVELHNPFVNMHEGFAVIYEEFDELKAEVWKNPRKHPERARQATEEAVQTAAMAARFVFDVGVF